MTKPKTFKNWVLKTPRFTIREPGVYSHDFEGRWKTRKWASMDAEQGEDETLLLLREILDFLKRGGVPRITRPIESRESTSMEGKE